MYCVDVGNSEKEEVGPNYVLLEVKEIKDPKIWCLDPNGLDS